MIYMLTEDLFYDRFYNVHVLYSAIQILFHFLKNRIMEVSRHNGRPDVYDGKRV